MDLVVFTNHHRGRTRCHPKTIPLQNTLHSLLMQMTENTNQAQYRSDRQDILTAWQKDTPVKTPDNRQVLDTLEAHVQDKLSINKSLNDRLGLTEYSLPGAQSVTVAMVQCDKLTTRIPNNLPNRAEIGQQDDNDCPDDRKENLYQVDGTMDIHTLLIILQMMKIQSHIKIHIKSRERHMLQQIQLEKI